MKLLFYIFNILSAFSNILQVLDKNNNNIITNVSYSCGFYISRYKPLDVNR